MAVELKAPATGKSIVVTDEQAEFWRSHGYTDAKPVRAPKRRARENKPATEPDEG